MRPRIWRPLRLPVSGRTIIHIDDAGWTDPVV